MGDKSVQLTFLILQTGTACQVRDVFVRNLICTIFYTASLSPKLNSVQKIVYNPCMCLLGCLLFAHVRVLFVVLLVIFWSVRSMW